MKRALELAREGHGQVVAAMGEAGVGKSRLFFEFKAIAQSGCLVLEAYSVSHGKASAYLPVIDLLKSYFEIASEDDERKRREKITGKVLCSTARSKTPCPTCLACWRSWRGEDPLAQMDPQFRRRRTLAAIKRMLMRESLNQPLIVVFEDLHWIDGGTQALLNLIVDASPQPGSCCWSTTAPSITISGATRPTIPSFGSTRSAVTTPTKCLPPCSPLPRLRPCPQAQTGESLP